MPLLLDQLRRLFRPKLSCEDVNRFLAEYVEGVLDPAVQARFEDHLDRCPTCQPYFDQYLATLRLVREEGGIDPPEEIVAHTLAFLRAHL